MSLSLQVHKSAKFRSDLKLSNGQTQLSYEEEIRGQAGAGRINIPDTFKIGIPVFVDGDLYPIEARFRYKLGSEGELTLSYELIRPLDVYRAAIKAVSEKIQAQLPDVPLWIGKRK